MLTLVQSQLGSLSQCLGDVCCGEKFIHWSCTATVAKIWALSSLVFALDLPSSVTSVIPNRLCSLEFLKVTDQTR